MKTYTKTTLIQALREISESGWHKAERDTRRARNDGAAGNLLESLLGIEENNLPLPNANEWELKVQRRGTASLLTLKHLEPSPRAFKFVSDILLPKYGWRHAEAGNRYPAHEMSFRQTVAASEFTNRGFKIEIDSDRVSVRFDSQHVSPVHAEWLDSVRARVGNIEDLNPRPYWGLEDLSGAFSAKLNNAFYVIADSKKLEGQEYFRYSEVRMLSGFSINGFVELLETGNAFVDFDARTGHNHGTKFRVRRNQLPNLYAGHDLVVPPREVAIPYGNSSIIT